MAGVDMANHMVSRVNRDGEYVLQLATEMDQEPLIPNNYHYSIFQLINLIFSIF